MESIGAEVGQKMRSAIRAKLMELGCYVDDELPDYVMVMVANKRTRSQMIEDLQLFLKSDTNVFVEWLQQVLKKLKAVTITKPPAASTSVKELKRKVTIDYPDIKKERKDKKAKIEPVKSLTDEIPVQATKLVENRKIHLEKSVSNKIVVDEDNFDIPSLAEVNELEDSELDLVVDKIKEARNRLVLMESDSEDEDFINIRADGEDLLCNELEGMNPTNPNTEELPKNNSRVIKIRRDSYKTKNDSQHEPNNLITTTIKAKSPVRKIPISERLGTRAPEPKERPLKHARISVKKDQSEMLHRIKSSIQSIIRKPSQTTHHIQKRESVHKRLGLLPSVVVSLPLPEVNASGEEQPKSVMSVVQVKPRRMTPGPCQANKNLLLKAMAEAQKSVAQLTTVKDNSSKKGLFTKKYREQHNLKPADKKPLAKKEKKGVENIIIEINRNRLESDLDSCSETKVMKSYAPPISTIDLNYDDDLDKYIEEYDNERPNSEERGSKEEATSPETKHQFIVTLDGVDEELFPNKDEDVIRKPPVMKRGPSPIIFNVVNKKASVMKMKERCKYWPGCRLKDACEYIHPNTTCKTFPLCKFGERCLYIHPKCKFLSSCTRVDCPFDHGLSKKNPVVKSTVSQEICKYHLKCTNLQCHYYHPKPCRFGNKCVNKECTFSHEIAPNKDKLKWHSNMI